MTDSMNTSTVDDTRGSAFSAVRVNSMRLADKWVCDNGASHHMIANKQYFATHNRSLAPVNISLADKEKIWACGSGRVNIEILVEASGALASWKTCGTFPILKATSSRKECGRTRYQNRQKNRRVMFQHDGQLVAISG